jgi:tRNA threonylcarbamoyl adenosine modification protein YjeE
MLELRSEQDTIALAERIAPLLRAGDIICLSGNLGSGKTFFAKALGKCLGVEEFIDSPSFVLLKEYHDGRIPLYHLDLYRLRNEAEFLSLGVTDLVDTGVTLIEWPELAKNLLPEQMLNLELCFGYDGSTRHVELVAKDRFADHLSS